MKVTINECTEIFKYSAIEVCNYLSRESENVKATRAIGQLILWGEKCGMFRCEIFRDDDENIVLSMKSSDDDLCEFRIEI